MRLEVERKKGNQDAKKIMQLRDDSNFLLVERPFSVGDVIRVGSTSGEVLSIDLLSLKIRTFENLYVRIPNETIIKSEVTTLKNSLSVGLICRLVSPTKRI